MLRVTDDILELRHWAEERCGYPCRELGGRVILCFVADPSPALAIGWDEFEPIFSLGRLVAVYDDGPGCNEVFVGTSREAREYVARADPRASGASGPTP
jgi:hypothetical protein